MHKVLSGLLLFVTFSYCLADDSLSNAFAAVKPKVIDWRRDIHANPELGNREFATAKKVAEHLRSLGLEVDSGLAYTGVIGYLKGGQEGPLVALRADMDALPVTEQTNVPFASKVKTTYRGESVGVMHACGHDTHTAMLMGVAEVLTSMREQLKGDVLFIFQPAEEGAPEGEEGGAELMLKQGLFQRYQPAAIFGLHVTSRMPMHYIGYREGPAMASSDQFKILVNGKQTHGSRPWQGVDPITTAAQIIMATQTIASRQIDVTKAPSVISFGAIKGGIRTNIIPDQVEMIGTIRSFDAGIRADIHKKLKFTAEQVAIAAGATAEVDINIGYNVTVNNPQLTEHMLPTLHKVTGQERVVRADLITGAEDFSFFAEQVPGLYVFLGVTPPDQDPAKAPSNHSPLFFADERALDTGVRLLTRLALDFKDNPL